MINAFLSSVSVSAPACCIIYKPQNEMKYNFKSFCTEITSVNTNRKAIITFILNYFLNAI